MAYPPIRASTLATFDVVTTRPKTRSPGWTVVSLTATSRICGAEFGATRGTFLETGGIKALLRFGTDGDGLGEADVAAGVGVADAVGATGAVEAAGRAGATAGPGFAGRDGWLQPASAVSTTAIQSVGRGRHICSGLVLPTLG